MHNCKPNTSKLYDGARVGAKARVEAEAAAPATRLRLRLRLEH